MRPHADGVLLSVKATPGARRSRIRGVEQDALVVFVTDIAEKGKANRAVIELLCEELGLKRSQIVLVRGQTSRQKQFFIKGCQAKELGDRIQATIG